MVHYFWANEEKKTKGKHCINVNFVMKILFYYCNLYIKEINYFILNCKQKAVYFIMDFEIILCNVGVVVNRNHLASMNWNPIKCTICCKLIITSCMWNVSFHFIWCCCFVCFCENCCVYQHYFLIIYYFIIVLSIVGVVHITMYCIIRELQHNQIL